MRKKLSNPIKNARALISIFRSNRKARKAEGHRKAMKLVNDTKGAPHDARTAAGRAQIMAPHIRREARKFLGGKKR